MGFSVSQRARGWILLLATVWHNLAYAAVQNWLQLHTLPQHTSLLKFALQANPLPAAQIAGLKNTSYGLFFKQGIFAGQDDIGESTYNYQRWQVPLLIGALNDYNLNYLGVFHDFLADLAASEAGRYGSYPDFLQMLYQVNNWDIFPLNQQLKLCQINGYCAIIDDRLWWANVFITYALGLRRLDPHNPKIKVLLGYAYKIFLLGLSRDEYINTIGTAGAPSIMWHSGPSDPPYYKSTISNSLYVTAGARLAQLILHKYGRYNREFKYHLVLKNTLNVANGYFLNYKKHNQAAGLLLDGVGTGNKAAQKTQQDYPLGMVVAKMYSYNQGVILPGMAILSQLTHQAKYLNYAKQLVTASYNYAEQHNGYFDDYGYTLAGGWKKYSDGLAFRLAYWQYFSLFLENYNFHSDHKFSQLLIRYVNQNARQIVVRQLNLPGYTNESNLQTLATPNHNNLIQPQTGELFSEYPDGYSLPGIAAALELLILQERLAYLHTVEK